MPAEDLKLAMNSCWKSASRHQVRLSWSLENLHAADNAVSVPVVIVYTKYDTFVAAQEYALLDKLENIESMTEDEVNEALRRGAQESFGRNRQTELEEQHLEGMPPFVCVSSTFTSLYC